MPAWFQRNPALIALAALAVVLVLAIALEMGVGGPAPSVAGAGAKRAAASDAKLLPPLVAVVAEQAYPEMAARPLLTPTRRPAPEPVVQAAVVRGQFILLGTTVAGPTRIALLKEKSSGRIHRVESGKDINGIKITQIEPESVTLAHGSENEVLTLQVQRPAAIPGAAPSAAAPLVQGPFGPMTPGTPPPLPSPLPGTPQPGANAPPAPAPGQQSLAVPGVSFMPPSSAPAVIPAADVPQAASSPMTPEELLARRRARRAQQTE
jgi:hypothetical protein